MAEISEAGHPYHQYRWKELTWKEAGLEEHDWDCEPPRLTYDKSGQSGWIHKESGHVIFEHDGELSDRLWEQWCRDAHIPSANVPLQAEYEIRQKLVTQFMQIHWFKHYENSTIGWMRTESDYDFTRGGGSYFTVPTDLMMAVRDASDNFTDLSKTDEEIRERESEYAE